ncbi:MAG TPA: nuclear transport factor 2 family protein [Chryseolinea sp.]
MKISMLGLFLLVITAVSSYAQTSTSSTLSKEEQEVVNLSKDKWQWMADKNIDKLAVLFHDKSKFVHMSGTWKKDEELEIIKSGTIWYKKATIHDTAIEINGKTAIVWNRITLESEVRGSDAKVEFTVTEVYQKEGKNWKMLALTFSSVRDTHVIKH